LRWGKSASASGVVVPSRKGEILWAELEHSQPLRVLHNRRYAGQANQRRLQDNAQALGSHRRRSPPVRGWRIIVLFPLHPRVGLDRGWFRNQRFGPFAVMKSECYMLVIVRFLADEHLDSDIIEGVRSTS